MNFRVEVKLQEYESKHGIQRWSADSDIFKDMKRVMEEVEKDEVVEAMERCARERWFLLHLKAKFAGKFRIILISFVIKNGMILFIDGQYLASRLSKTINSLSSKLKQLLKDYNSFPSVSVTDSWSWSGITNFGNFNLIEDFGTNNENIPKKIQLDAIKFHHLVMRSEEEIKLIENEMKATISFYQKDWQELVSAVKERSVMPLSTYNLGALQALQLVRLKCEETLHRLVDSFGQFLKLESLPVNEYIVLPSHVYHFSNNGRYFFNHCIKL